MHAQALHQAKMQARHDYLVSVRMQSASTILNGLLSSGREEPVELKVESALAMADELLRRCGIEAQVERKPT
jgi:hypothetical protein